MYYPILRGKQHELAALQEVVNVISYISFCPVIEPVTESLNPIFNTINTLNSYGISPQIIINPPIGFYKNDNNTIINYLRSFQEISFLPCIFIENSKIPAFENWPPQFSLFLKGEINSEVLSLSKFDRCKYVFVHQNVSPLVMQTLNNVILYNDNFKKQIKNAEYPSHSSYSSLHTYYRSSPVVRGFADYTIMPEDFSKSGGGPAFVVALHLSYINKSEFREMLVKHYLSYDDNSPDNVAKKFHDAVQKMLNDIDNNTIPFYISHALHEFRELYNRPHYPGLGVAKRICIKHHIETLNDYLSYG